MSEGRTFRVAALVTDGFQEVEFRGPHDALVAAGAQVDIVSDRPGEVQALSYYEPTRSYPVTTTIDKVRVEDYDAVFSPGGAHHPPTIAADGRFTDFIRDMNEAGRFVTSICRGGLVLAAAGVVEGKRVTGSHNNVMGEEWWFYSVKGPLEEAGGVFVEDQSTVVDGNLITARYPGDIQPFSAALVERFGLR